MNRGPGSNDSQDLWFGFRLFPDSETGCQALHDAPAGFTGLSAGRPGPNHAKRLVRGRSGSGACRVMSSGRPRLPRRNDGRVHSSNRHSRPLCACKIKPRPLRGVPGPRPTARTHHAVARRTPPTHRRWVEPARGSRSASEFDVPTPERQSQHVPRLRPCRVVLK